jgi:peptidoglycan-associated lipoprotein
MKFIKLTHLMVLALALTVAGSGCRKGPQNVTPLPGSRSGAMVTDPGSGVPADSSTKTGGGDVSGGKLPDGGVPQAEGSHAGWPENAEIFKAYTVHFAFDSSVVKSSDASNVRSVADHLKSNPAQAVRVEGHCDERGTEEYNRALGERRALAIREELIKQGISGSRVDTISYGKDRPVDPGHNDAAHGKNRRGEFILLSPPSA